MRRKTTNFNKTGIDKLPNDKPVLFKILTPSGNTNYAGIAKKGRVQERLNEHPSPCSDYPKNLPFLF